MRIALNAGRIPESIASSTARSLRAQTGSVWDVERIGGQTYLISLHDFQTLTDGLGFVRLAQQCAARHDSRNHSYTISFIDDSGELMTLEQYVLKIEAWNIDLRCENSRLVGEIGEFQELMKRVE